VKRRALLVTPDRATLNLCATALGMRGFDVARAQSAAYARALVESHRPRVVIFEYPYELEGGFDLLKQLQDGRRTGGFKVLAVTGSKIPAALEAVVKEQADATLPAPVGAAVIATEAVRLAELGQGTPVEDK
jgi:ActR/RegA family two-component response regulator